MHKKLLVIGGLPNKEHKCQYGGATVLMDNFIEYLTKNKYNFRFVQTNKFIDPQTLQLRPLKNNIYFLYKFICNLHWCDVVMFNFSDNSTAGVFPLLSRISRIFGKKVILRKFGGSLSIYFNNLSDRKIERLTKALKACDMIFLETKAAISHLEQLLGKSETIHWFPNVRKNKFNKKNKSEIGHRIGFLSHICDSKGVGDIIEAVKLLPKKYIIELYGAIKEDKYENINWEEHNIKYFGEISSDEVGEILPQLSLVLLPSYKEGYPGIIIESLAAGVPVIGSNVGGIPEIIKDGINGRIVNTGSPKEIADAILSFNSENYASYSENAYKTFTEYFESDKTNERIVLLISNL